MSETQTTRTTINDKADEQTALAVQVAKLYYHQGLTTESIAGELGLSRPTISRLLSYAKRSGLVEIRIHDPQARPQSIEAEFIKRYPFLTPHIVPVPLDSNENVWLGRVAVATANLLNQILVPRQIIGLAWGTTLEAVSRALTPKLIPELQFVQLNGSANALDYMSGFVTDTVTRFAKNYGARTHIFPVPTFFDHAETKQAMWRERSLQNVLNIQSQANVLLYSIGSPSARIPSHVYVSAYLDEHDIEELRVKKVAGDIATVFFRADGSYADIPLNHRASGPDLSITQHATYAICVVSGLGKVEAIRAALNGRLMNHLVIDEVTAQALLSSE
jgi:deoxyribonucleoside regulator